MGVTSFSQEIACPVPPQRMFKALILDGDNLITKLMPQAIKSVDTIQGDGGAGSIKQINFAEGTSFKYTKHQIDELDIENKFYKYTLIEGDDALMGKLESIANEIKFETSADGVGSVCKMTSHCCTVGTFEIKDEEIKEGKEKAMGLYKAVEAHLLANPDAYN